MVKYDTVNGMGLAGSPNEKPSHVYFAVPWKPLLQVVIGLPLFGFAGCVVLSMVLHYEGTTRTHCKVPNYLPSISAAVGDHTPEIYVWRICIALHCAPRFMFAVIYYNLHISRNIAQISSLYRYVAGLACVLHVVENSALVGLTYISSSENYVIHENCFILFMVCSLVYMVITCILFRCGNEDMSLKAAKSLQIKQILFVMNLFSFLTAVYFFFRHSWYCEAGVYTIFSFLEYITIVTNILFHGTILLDLEGYALLVAPSISNKDN